MNLLKQIGLMVPAIRRLYNERDQYAQIIQELGKELASVREKHGALQVQFDNTLQSNLLQQHRAISENVEMLRAYLEKNFSRIGYAIEDIHRESFLLTRNESKDIFTNDFQVETDAPIAAGSDDHKHPRGTRNDNTRHPRFVLAAERLFGKKLKVLELGCAGGGLVLDFVLNGHDAIGIEGSDYSRTWQRAEWGVIPDRLFTADITRPFKVEKTGNLQKFDLVTAWEVLEHIPDESLDGLFENIHNHLAPEGLFCASVATFEDSDQTSGAIWHVTVKPREWWVDRAERAGFEVAEGLFTTQDFPRGSGNPRASDWDAALNPEFGFHICLRLKAEDV